MTQIYFLLILVIFGYAERLRSYDESWAFNNGTTSIITSKTPKTTTTTTTLRSTDLEDLDEHPDNSSTGGNAYFPNSKITNYFACFQVSS